MAASSKPRESAGKLAQLALLQINFPKEAEGVHFWVGFRWKVIKRMGAEGQEEEEEEVVVGVVVVTENGKEKEGKGGGGGSEVVCTVPLGLK